ncbi:hypothetical protein HYH03_006243 [Edaphochlamys debaryana]|uniref:Poly(A) RNA polymerase mitochondrial-like central palm domain-containing protein n=1 Tax=Edaphochlamys debaryana TaxID=47281 RepID=A0A836C1I1_9CHLO|nr:hypothetical protein HYH03_006243 [Edaphochlamys debaryana]|eukprot:KAG2495643.1 hypothetical protein HYH03_006243 [Edaphochlamys debaryana]
MAGGQYGRDAERTAPPGSAPEWNEDVASALEAQLHRLQTSLQPTPEDATARQQAIARLQALLADIFPPPRSVTLVPYGSFLTGCYSHGSDLDLALTGSVTSGDVYYNVPEFDLAFYEQPLSLEEVAESGSAPLLLEELAAALEKRGAVKGRVDRGGLPARVPVIRLVEATTGVACDVCVCTRGCDVKGETMRLLQGLQPALAPLTRLVKAWAKQHDINCALRGTLNSWSLELLTVFSLQTHPGGPLLPPMWGLFGDKPPPPGHGMGPRPLQGTTTPPADALARARERCSGSARAELLPAGPAPPLPALFRWFLVSTAWIMEDWRAKAVPFVWDSSSTRVSTWLGRLHDRAYDKKPYGTLPYVALIEEPFDSGDNTARSLGTKGRNEDTLPYITWVFSHSHHTLSAVASVGDSVRALLWLFGPAALPCLGTSPASLVPYLSYGQAEHVSAAVTKALRQLCPDGPGAAEGAVKEQSDDRAASAGKVSAFRALLDAARVGSPILTLSDWRSHHACCRTRPPYVWHRIGQAEAPEPEPAAEPAEVSAARGGATVSVTGHQAAARAKPAEPGPQPGPSGNATRLRATLLTALWDEAARQGYPYIVPYPCEPPPGWRVFRGLLFSEDMVPAAELESALQEEQVGASERDAFEAHFLVDLAMLCMEITEVVDGLGAGRAGRGPPRLRRAAARRAAWQGHLWVVEAQGRALEA